MNRFTCPNCGSGNTQAFSSIRESGTFSGGSSSIGTALVAGEAVPVTGYTSTGGMTALASRLGPPEPMRSGVWRWILLEIVLTIVITVTWGKHNYLIEQIAYVIGGAVVLPLYIFNRRKAAAYNAEVYRPALHSWQNSMHCFKCNHDFVVQ